MTAAGDRPGTRDPLSRLLRVVRLDGAFFFEVEAAEPWSIVTMASRELLRRLMPAAEHLISCYILTGGRCYAGVPGGEPVELAPGDISVFPHGDAHVISSRPGSRVGADGYTTSPARYFETVVLGGQEPRPTSLVCGYFGCDRRLFSPLLAALPRMIHLRGVSPSWPGLLRQVIEESRLGRPGADGVQTRLAEWMLIEVLRHYLDELPTGQTGWLAGLRDDIVARVLALLHDQPGHPWTIPELARAVGSSRSNVTRRFTLLVGQSPMQYLTRWRMQIAANTLTHSGEKIASIGADVGYESEAAFSRAFKKVTGLAPGAWREFRRTVLA